MQTGALRTLLYVVPLLCEAFVVCLLISWKLMDPFLRCPWNRGRRGGSCRELLPHGDVGWDCFLQRKDPEQVPQHPPPLRCQMMEAFLCPV